MQSKKILYAAKFFGIKKVDDYIESLQSNSAFSLSITREEKKIIVHITGPKKTTENVSLQDLHEQLSNNAQKLGVNDPELVEKTKQDIYNAQTAEKIVLDGEMQFEAETNIIGGAGFVTLEVIYDVNPQVEACIDQYAFWRITCLANVMGMSIEGSIVKNAGNRVH